MNEKHEKMALDIINEWDSLDDVMGDYYGLAKMFASALSRIEAEERIKTLAERIAEIETYDQRADRETIANWAKQLAASISQGND